MELWQLSPRYFETMHHPTPAWNCCLPNWTSVIFPSLLMCVLCVSSRDVSMSHSMSWSWVVRSSRRSILLEFSFSSCCHVGWSSQSKTSRQRWWLNQRLMKCNLDREDYVSLRFPFILPYAWISGRDSCLVGASCHIPSFWCCLVFASCFHHV